MADVRMDVAGLSLDPTTNAPILILKVADEDRLLPIWIGPMEASAIALELEHVKLPRPMTHDLLRDLVRILGGKLVRARVSAVRQGTFFATLEIERDGRCYELDARPSDAVAWALRSGCPVEVAVEVLETAGVDPAFDGAGPRMVLDPEEDLEALAPEDFGRYEQ
jgi:bifunctional DNase/RNase